MNPQTPDASTSDAGMPAALTDDERRHLLVELAALAEDHRTMPTDVASRLEQALAAALDTPDTDSTPV